MKTRIMRVDDDVYELVAKLAKEKGVSYTEALKLLINEKQNLPGIKKDEVFNLGILENQHFVYKELLGEEFVCAICMEQARKKHPFLLTYERTKYCYMRGRDEVENHFREKHPEVVEILDKKRE